jgi:O-antigen/teichoic acid export membrane protein
MGIAAVLSVGLNLILIPTVGFLGAAGATLASYAVLATVTAAFGQRHYPIGWDVPRVTGAILVGLVLAAAALLGPDHALWRIATILVFPLALLGLRIVAPGELRTARQMLRRGGRG